MGYTSDKTTKVTLPSNKDYWAKVRVLTLGDLKDYFEYGGTKGPLSVDEKLAKAITEWNLDDDKGEALPITAASIDLLKENDANALAIAATPKEDDRSKKNSQSTSTDTSSGKS